MELLVDQARFHAALTLAATVADRRGTTPVLSNALLSARSDNTLRCCSTDSNLYLIQDIPAEVKSAGSLCASVKHLAAVLKTLHAGPVQVEGLENHRAQLKSGRSEFRIVGLPERDFPTPPDDSELEYQSYAISALQTLIQKTIFSVSTDEARINLNGALVAFQEQHTIFVSTDGHRLTLCQSIHPIPQWVEKNIVVPRKALIELKKVLDRVEDENIDLALSDQHLFVRGKLIQLVIKLSKVTFPPYEQVIPKNHEHFAVVPRQEVISALRSAEVMAPEKTATVRLEFKPSTLEITADNPELGVSKQEVEIEYDGEEIVAGFNARYLIEALEACPGEFVTLRFQGALDPWLLEPNENLPETEFRAVVMPMRI